MNFTKSDIKIKLKDYTKNIDVNKLNLYLDRPLGDISIKISSM